MGAVVESVHPRRARPDCRHPARDADPRPFAPQAAASGGVHRGPLTADSSRRSRGPPHRGTDARLAARGVTPAAFGRRCIPTPTPTRWKPRVGGPGLTALLLL